MTSCPRIFPQMTFLLKTPSPIEDDKMYTCNVCSRAFMREGHLRIHVKKHSEGKPYECKICSKTYAYEAAFEKHLECHSRVQGYACEVCSQVYTDKKNLFYHSLTHKKSSVCKICCRSFTTKGNLKSHLKTHTKIQPDTSVNSRKPSSCQESLKTEILTGNTKKKLYTCKMCNKTFLYRIALNIHTRSHTEIKSETCKI